jgi:hypothetical protein
MALKWGEGEATDGGNGVWRSNLTALYNMRGSDLIDRHSVPNGRCYVGARTRANGVRRGQWGQICPFGSAAKPPVFGNESTALGRAQIGNDTFSPIGRFDFGEG